MKFDNTRIKQQLESMLDVLPANAELKTDIKISRVGTTDNVEHKKTAEDIEGLSRLANSFTATDPYVVENVTTVVNYDIADMFVAMTVRIFNDGTAEVARTIGPDGETPAFQGCPRSGAPLATIIGNLETPHFMKQWLHDFISLATVYGFFGKITIAGSEYEMPIGEKSIRSFLSSAIAKGIAKGRSINASATLTRDSTRPDFIDILSMKVSTNRKADVSYTSQERAPQLLHPKKIGRTTTLADLKLTSDAFPNGFEPRRSEAFLVPCTNLAANTVTMIPWPDRTRMTSQYTEWPRNYAFQFTQPALRRR